MYNKYIEYFSDKFDLPKWLIWSICKQESNFNQFACRYEENYRWLFHPEEVKPKDCSLKTEVVFQKTSWGLMQVMGAVYREYGYNNWLPEISCDIETQLLYGCKHLNKLNRRWGSYLWDVVAAYNAGSPRRTTEGYYINQGYVDSIMKHKREYEELHSS